MKKIFYAVNAIAATALVFAYISPFVNPSITGFFAFFGLGYPFLLVTNVLFVFFWLAFKPKYALMSFVMLLIGYSPFRRAVGFGHGDNMSTAQGKDRIKGKEKSSDRGELDMDISFEVMTYNIGKTRIDFHHKGREKKIKAFTRFIHQQKPDVICLQERLPRHLKYYERIFVGYNLYPDSDIGTAIYSKYPIIKGGNLPFNTKSHNATWADIKINGKTFRFYAIHLSSNRVTNLTDNVKEIWDESKYILSKYFQHAIKRSQQLEQVIAHAKASPHPVVISGDFNDVPQSYVYRLIDKAYKDAFTEGGSGLMQTFISRFIGLRIDYTFTNESIKILDQKIIKTGISDHYPLVTKIATH